MPVYEDMIEWLDSRPLWQRDAVRRLLRGDLVDEDVRELAELALSETGGPAVAATALPVQATDFPRDVDVGPDVRLTGVVAAENLNAIVGGSVLNLASSGLTVVYGDNGSGKSGYVRLLKEVCRARSRARSILPDVFGAQAGPPRAQVQYLSGGEPQTFDWQQGAQPPDELARVSVFDRACASVYVTAENEVAYRPFGLDLMDGLARAARSVQAELEQRRSRLVPVAPSPPEGLTRHEPIALYWPISAQTDRRLVADVGPASEEWAADIQALEQALAAEDPIARARAARAVRATIERMKRRLDELYLTVSTDQVASFAQAQQTARTAQAALDTMTREALAAEALEGVGGNAWHELWSAAERYSTGWAYPEHEFPNVEPGSRCVLCGQTLDEAAAVRLQRLKTYVQDEVGAVAQRARVELDARVHRFRQVNDQSRADDDLAAALAEAVPSLTPTITAALLAARMRVEAVLATAEAGHEVAIPDFDELPPIDELAEAIARLDNDVALLERAANPQDAQSLRDRLAQMKAISWTAQHRDALLAEIERLQLVQAYERAISACDTHAITNMNNELTRRYVTAALQNDVARELAGMNAERIRVELAWRGQRAISLHRFELRGATTDDARIDEVISEGEFGALALAAFLAEVRQQRGRSSIVLDDPVSSLDHLYRSRVARRLAQEAIERPVVVFTHDLLFLHDLEGAAESVGAAMETRYVRAGPEGVGQPVDGAPWRGMSATNRIEDLRRRLDGIRDLAMGDSEAYESAVREWYGLLREAWERSIEDTLFGGAIIRYRHDIQTRRLSEKLVWVVEENDIAEVERGMTRASAWLRGHDQPQAANAPVPSPDEMHEDLLALDRWNQSLTARRRAARQAAAAAHAD